MDDKRDTTVIDSPRVSFAEAARRKEMADSLLKLVQNAKKPPRQRRAAPPTKKKSR